MEGEKLLDTQETIKRLKISRTTLYKIIKQGKITPVETPAYLDRPAKLQFRESDVNKLLTGGS